MTAAESVPDDTRAAVVSGTILVLRAVGWPAAVIVACATLWWFVPPIRSASSEPTAFTRDELQTLKTDVALTKQGVADLKEAVSELRSVMLDAPRAPR